MQKIFLGIAICIYATITMVACSSVGNNDIEPTDNQGNNNEKMTLQTEEKYGRQFVFFAQVNKSGNYFRRILVEASAAETLLRGQPLPANALFAMETWFGNEQSTVYIRQKNGNREMLSGSFSPLRPNYTVLNDNSCNSCHQRARVTQDIFTLPLLQKAIKTNQLQTIRCNQSSFTPCELEVYQGN